MGAGTGEWPLLLTDHTAGRQGGMHKQSRPRQYAELDLGVAEAPQDVECTLLVQGASPFKGSQYAGRKVLLNIMGARKFGRAMWGNPMPKRVGEIAKQSPGNDEVTNSSGC